MYNLLLLRAQKKKQEKGTVFLPSHAAEQHNKKLKNNSAELCDFPSCLFFVSSAGQP